MSSNLLLAWVSGSHVQRFLVDHDSIWDTQLGAPVEIGLNGADPMELVKQRYPTKKGANFAYAELNAGEYHPRFYRGLYSVDIFKKDETPPYDREEHAASREQENILVDELEAICRVCAPDDETSMVYGSRIRNLLILASTEVEALMKGVLKKNQYTRASSGHWTMTDYVKLAVPMRLAAYKQKLRVYKRYAEFAPFDGWVDNNTKPAWYDAYNSAKHDREDKMPEAKLKHAISAVAAVGILMIAQYGEELRHAAGFFQTTGRPKWIPTERTYPDPHNGDSWTLVPYKF